MALFLRGKGHRAWALRGGYWTWREAGYPTDSEAAEVARRAAEVCRECNRPWDEHPDAR